MAKRVHNDGSQENQRTVMKGLYPHPIRSVVSYFSIALLASSVAFAAPQYPNSAPSAPNTDQQTPDANGGWRRVGDPPPIASSNAPSYPSISSDQSTPNDTAQSGDDTNQMPAQNQSNYPQPNYSAPPPIPTFLTIPAGTFITVRVNQPLSSDKNQPGDAFSATLIQPLVVNGIVIAEPGQTVGGQVAMVQKHGVGQAAKLGIRLTTLTLVDGQQVTINSQLISRQGGTTPGGAEAGTVVATTGLGAAIGAAAGWGTGAAIGAGAGAAAGLIGVLVTHNHPSVIYPEQVLTFRLDAPVTISTTSAAQAFHYVQPGEYDRSSGPAPGSYQQYSTAAPPPPAPYYAYPYPYPYYYGYPYPYWWGPSFAFYWGPRFYYGRGFVGPYYGGFYRGPGFVAGGVGRAGGWHR